MRKVWHGGYLVIIDIKLLCEFGMGHYILLVLQCYRSFHYLEVQRSIYVVWLGGHLREWRLVISRGKGGALIYGDLGWWAGILPSFWDFSF